jgi:hypothetical protein
LSVGVSESSEQEIKYAFILWRDLYYFKNKNNLKSLY